MAIITLGGFTFEGFGIPERVPLGGEQRKQTHELLGGARVVDAMGPSEADITWSGRFQGPDALDNAHGIDALRIAGLAVPLVIDTEFRTVLITSFPWVYERFYQVLYTITCHVVVQPITPSGGLSLDVAIALDLASAVAAVADFADL
jgi:hypothetical protein